MDGGDLFGLTADPLRDLYVARAIGRLGYDAINIGDQDGVAGVDFLLEQAHTHNLPLVSANVTADTPAWKKQVLPWRLVEVGPLQAAIIGIASTKAFRFNKAFTIQPMEETLARQVQMLKDRVDLVVVLSHAGFERDQELARRVAGIDVIVGGHSRTLLKEAVQVGQTLIVQAGKNGQYLGMLTLYLEERRIRAFTNRLIPLDKRVASDAGLEHLVAEYHGLLKARIRQKQAGRLSPTRFGAGYCTSCHEPQTRHWETTAHRHAYDTLVHEGKQDNPECRSCHVTLVGDLTRGVQCLSCHPIAKNHGQSDGVTVVPQVSEVQCRSCHDAVRDPEFPFAEKRNLVTH